jgi:hypothetical protein
MLYGQSSYLLSSDGRIVGESSTGCRQGDPLSMIFFAVGFQQALMKVQALVESLQDRLLANQRYHPGFVLAYADDVGVAADINVLAELYPLLHEIYATAGLRISPKSVMVNLSDFPIQIVDNLSHTVEGTKFLGMPIGSNVYKNSSFQESIRKVMVVYDRLG